MAHRSGRGRFNRLLAPLLFLITCAWQAAAAPPSADETAYRKAREMLDRGKADDAFQAADAALAAAGMHVTEWTCAWRVLRGEVIAQKRGAEASAILETPLPAQCATSEAAVRRLMALSYMAFYFSKERKNAAPLVNQALALAKKHQPQMQAEVLYAMGTVGDPDTADANLRRAIELAHQQKNPVVETKALAALSMQRARNDEFAEAIHYGEQARVRARASNLWSTVVRIEANLGWALVQIGDYDGAARYLATSEADAARLGLTPTRITTLLQLGNVAAGGRNLAEAARRYQQALELTQTAADRANRASLLANLASVNIELGRFEEASALNAEATKLKQDLKEENALLRSRIIDGRIALGTGQLALAETILRGVAAAATEPSTKWESQARLGSVYAATGRKRDAENQFQNAIRTAGAARKTMVSDWQLRLNFTTLLVDVFAAYLDFLIRDGRATDALRAVENYRAQSLEEGLEVAAPDARLDPREIAQQSHATVLCYWLGPAESYLWVVTSKAVELHRLPPDVQVNAEVDAYQRDVRGTRGTLDGLRSRGERLFRLLVGPAGSIAKGRRVIVVPDGHLHSLNFETLVVPPAKTAAKPHYWIEDVILTTAGSLQLAAPVEAKPSATASMLLVGDAPTVDPAYPKLRYAADEVTKVAAQFKSPRILTGTKATPAAYAAAQPGGFDYLHFVAHGVASREEPLKSAVILGKDTTKTYRLAATQIVKTPLKARLVTISSCYGVGSRNYAGEGLVGLAWAFLRAGADQVIAALWEVNDQTTPDLMREMYKGIQAGQEPAVALRNAKLTLVRSTGLGRKPSFWGPFVLYTGR
jgi:CHAT domain-containing protein